ncbi:DNA primase [Niabella sp. 22666]|uniref:DNA primase n=1 Tax=Niabella sp. 22666 TaxID=3453954 RepID=UPI003F86F663
MIAPQTVNNVKEIAPSEVIKHFVADLEHKGANWQGCCPFHGENTPSFTVSDAKGIFKCFGCGISGDAIEFVIQHERKTFTEAVITIANLVSIPVEMQEMTEEAKKKYEERISEIEKQEKVLSYVVPVYQKLLHNLSEDHPAKVWLKKSGYNADVIAEWQIGWAGDEWNTVTGELIKMDLWSAAEKLNISKRSLSNDSNYDVYRKRIIFPIKDVSGKIVGIGGRLIDDQAGKNAPKYLNPANCEIYNKSKVLYGLDKATKAIQDRKYAYVTEGYRATVSPHMAGITNTVATCGTALTEDQFKLLQRYTTHLVFWRDNDMSGFGSFVKSLPIALKLGFRADFAVYEGKQPDSYVQSLYRNNILCLDEPKREDGVIVYARHLMESVGEDAYRSAHAKQDILKLLANVPNEIVRNNYLDQLAKKYKWKASDTKNEFKGLLDAIITEEDDEEESAVKFDAWVNEEDRDSFFEKGYLKVQRKKNGKPMVGYYSFGPSGKTEITNFVVNPLFRVEADMESRYLSQIDNGHKTAVLDIPARVFASIEQFQGYALAIGGAFLIYGNKNQWLRIATDLLHNYDSCTEIISLGWNPNGFFAYIDKVYIPGVGLKEYDKWGIFAHGDKKFLLPAAGEAYNSMKGEEGDMYKHLRFLTYKKSSINFQSWADRMYKVYGMKGSVGIAYVVLTIFRDLVFPIDNNCPHLYGFGEPSSGKSKWAESITAVFYFSRAAFNLNSGTDFGFAQYVASFRNCPAHENEFDVEVVKQEWFQQIKGWYDGEGRQRGKIGGKKNAMEIQDVVSTIILTGQKLVTADDNSVVTRSLIEGFKTEEYTDEQRTQYDQLKMLERQGLNSVITELLQYRAEFEANYRDRFNNTLSNWRKHKSGASSLNQRIIQNYAHLSTCYGMVGEKVVMPIPSVEFDDYCYTKAVEWSGFIRSTDTLSEFWRTLEFLVGEDKVEEGWDFVVEEHTDLTIAPDRNNTESISFNEPTRIIFLRINNVHKLFQQAFRNRTGKEAMSLENIMHYFKSRKYFLGPVRSKRFNRYKRQVVGKPVNNGLNGTSEVPQIELSKESKVSSCYAFRYDDLEIDITRGSSDEDEGLKDLPF